MAPVFYFNKNHACSLIKKASVTINRHSLSDIVDIHHTQGTKKYGHKTKKQLQKRMLTPITMLISS